MFDAPRDTAGHWSLTVACSETVSKQHTMPVYEVTKQLVNGKPAWVMVPDGTVTDTVVISTIQCPSVFSLTGSTPHRIKAAAVSTGWYISLPGDSLCPAHAVSEPAEPQDAE